MMVRPLNFKDILPPPPLNVWSIKRLKTNWSAILLDNIYIKALCISQKETDSMYIAERNSLSRKATVYH